MSPDPSLSLVQGKTTDWFNSMTYYANPLLQSRMDLRATRKPPPQIFLQICCIWRLGGAL